MYELIPLVETWLEKEGFHVSILANKIEGKKQTGIFSSENITVLLEDYIGLCSVKMQGDPDVCDRLQKYLQSLTPKGIVTCPYCGTLFDSSEKRCPKCGAYIKG